MVHNCHFTADWIHACVSGKDATKSLQAWESTPYTATESFKIRDSESPLISESHTGERRLKGVGQGWRRLRLVFDVDCDRGLVSRGRFKWALSKWHKFDKEFFVKLLSIETALTIMLPSILTLAAILTAYRLQRFNHNFQSAKIDANCRNRHHLLTWNAACSIEWDWKMRLRLYFEPQSQGCHI